MRGNSQGGALTLLAAAAADAPFLTVVVDAIQLTNTYPYQEINDYLRQHPDASEAIRTAWGYNDCINFADKIQCPIIVNWAKHG